jgi:hypothetical protein
MEIAELILLLQNEVQRSYELIEDTIKDGSSTPIYISIDKMEIELPIVVTEKEKELSVEDLKKESIALQKFQLPFSLMAISKADKSEYIKQLKEKQVKGKSIQVEVLNESNEKTQSLTPEKIGRLRLYLKPVLKS